MPPLIYSNAHTANPHMIRVLQAISAHHRLAAPSASPPSEPVSAPTLPSTLAGAPLKPIISISDSNSDHEISRISAQLSQIRVFVIPDDSTDDSEYQEHLAEMAVLQAAKKKLKKKRKEGKRKATVSLYSDPEMEVFMAGLPLNDKSGMFSLTLYDEG